MSLQPTLYTAHLVLRPFELSDSKIVRKLAGDLAVADTTLNIPHPYEDGMAEEWISTHKAKLESREAVNFAITLRENGELLGAVSLGFSLHFDRAELGYWIGKPYWGKGYCTEASEAIVEYGFVKWKLNRIFAQHFKRNPASGRVMEKLGMKNERTARQHVKKWNRYEDMVMWGMLKKEWVRRKV